ncbi:hypothetical protein K432DRAFT_378837 [Lepidopterella palustris CBS 459.81]|uniref:Uncharacterized protein n=1 Tax=Lepidopterella palustris CBS 459.81 TaxID=1314670 RepID=A0A8E2EI17_9PEZI|nr:hypothetical protein K432DRAFT_378837 [Lepidopterella palustris CBS 459.81]
MHFLAVLFAILPAFTSAAMKAAHPFRRDTIQSPADVCGDNYNDCGQGYCCYSYEKCMSGTDGIPYCLDSTLTTEGIDPQSLVAYQFNTSPGGVAATTPTASPASPTTAVPASAASSFSAVSAASSSLSSRAASAASPALSSNTQSSTAPVASGVGATSKASVNGTSTQSASAVSTGAATRVGEPVRGGVVLLGAALGLIL